MTYADGTEATLPQEAHDVVHLPLLGGRADDGGAQATGAKVMLFLLVMTGVLYGAKRKIWQPVHEGTV